MADLFDEETADAWYAREARELLPESGGDPLAVAEGMRARYGNQAVLVTDGEAGCAIAAPTAVPTPPPSTPPTRTSASCAG